jgi:cell wall-associated NlpC family hydrolase
MIQAGEVYAANAVKWAVEQLGSADYPGLCYAFCEDAYEEGGNIWLDGQGRTAKEAADFYLARADSQPDACPPAGSYIFFDCSGEINGDYRNWGHMGLALGDGQIVHSWGKVRVDPMSAVESLPSPPGWTQPSYLGWCPPELVLVGMRVK